MKRLPVLGITMGDPAGVGPELCLRALAEPSVLNSCVPVIFGDVSVLRTILKSSLSLRKKLRMWTNGGIERYKAVPRAQFEKIRYIAGPVIMDCAAINDRKLEPGKISGGCGRAAYQYIEAAIRAAQSGQIAGVVTAPVHKEALELAGVKYPGHTEIFTALTGARRSCMMLYSDELAVSMATTHIGYADVPQTLSVQRILDVIELTVEALRRLRENKPRVGICGLNPHAGEHGLFGDKEEERFIIPAVAQAHKKGLDVFGPLVPDAAFTRAQRGKYDAIVTLYHDQGHIPFKMLAFDTGVNVTLGLPIVRTSVDHGTAFDIAWQGKADPTSLFSAIRLAAKLAQNKTDDLRLTLGTRNTRSRVNHKSNILKQK